MCCINIDPQAFLDWANPILEKKAEIRAEVKEAYEAEKKAFYARPWFLRGLLGEFDLYGRKLWWKLNDAGLFCFPKITDEEINCAKYCVKHGKEMPLDTAHDFFRG